MFPISLYKKTLWPIFFALMAICTLLFFLALAQKLRPNLRIKHSCDVAWRIIS